MNITKIAAQRHTTPEADEVRLLTKRQLGKRYGVVERTIENWMEWLPHLKIGKCVRFNPNQTDQAIFDRFTVNG